MTMGFIQSWFGLLSERWLLALVYIYVHVVIFCIFYCSKKKDNRKRKERVTVQGRAPSDRPKENARDAPAPKSKESRESREQKSREEVKKDSQDALRPPAPAPPPAFPQVPQPMPEEGDGEYEDVNKGADLTPAELARIAEEAPGGPGAPKAAA
ncbi:hypothetical protein ANCCAN_01757 [Ancylostoma caninum]|uniref:Uncharacterized protein n=1 Tax=Ancylostoma caninum TaxID=29170 RepID=A0A368H9E9_ANCCA|nr:hypothetical protein ANCCAN_01757 [Ancylostoma caninum]